MRWPLPNQSEGLQIKAKQTANMNPPFRIFRLTFLCMQQELDTSQACLNQMWYLQKSASDSVRILSKMALKDTDLWCLTAF